MTGDKVEKDKMVYAHLSDKEIALKVRMLLRNDLEHEPVCTGARDRIMYLSQQLESIANIAHCGGLIGFEDIHDALNEIRKLTLPYWDVESCEKVYKQETP